MSDPVRVALVNQAFVPPGMEIGQTGAHLPGLGLLMLASAIEEADPAMRGKIRYFDEEHLGVLGCQDSVVDWLSGAEDGIVMLTTYTMTHHRQEDFIQRMQEHGFICLAGGPHVTMHPEESSANAVVLGEGVSAMRSIFPWPGFLPHDAPGVRYRVVGEDGDVSWEGAHRPMRKLDPTMWPTPSFAYHLLPKEIKHRASAKRDLEGRRPMSIILSKGCPSACHFCTSGAQNGPWAVGPVDRFQADMNHMLAHVHPEAIEFHDDDLFSHPHIEGILAIIRATGLPWTCYSRANPLQGERGKRLAEMAQESGCKRVFLGLESMTDARLKALGKRATSSMNKEAVLNLTSSGIEVSAAWIVGLTEDTRPSLNEDLEKFLELPLTCLDVNILNINPGSVISKKVLNGKLAPACGASIESPKDLLPDPARYGHEEPWGQPTLCKALSKVELNVYANAARERIAFHLYNTEPALNHRPPPTVFADGEF